MADPSLLLSEDGIDLAIGGEFDLVVSRAFAEWLNGEGDFEFDPAEFAADEPDRDPTEFIPALREAYAAGRIETFSYEEADLDEEASRVLATIRDQAGPITAIDADQWAFLNSNSWLGSKARRTLQVFEQAGAIVIEAGREAGMNLLSEVIPMDERPRNVDAELLARGAIKWLVVGGASVGGGTLGGIVGMVVAGPVGHAVGHVIVRRLVKEASKRVLLAIDP